jgi:hypothetical protein
MKEKLKELVWIFKGVGTKFEEKREKKKNDRLYHTSDMFGTHATPSCRERIDLQNAAMEGNAWWLNNPACAAWTMQGCSHVSIGFLIIFNICKLQ